MLRLKTTVAACLALATIGSIIACSSQMAKSGGDTKTSSSPSAVQTTASPVTTAPASSPLPSAKELAKADEAASPTEGNAAQNMLAGSVQGAAKPIAGATVTLYAAGTDAPTQLAQAKTDDQGAFRLTYGEAPADSVLYVIARGGTPKTAADKGLNDAIALLAWCAARTGIVTPLPADAE